MDWCDHPSVPPVQVYGAMEAALNASGRPMYFASCEWGEDEPWMWGNQVANQWRIWEDHLPLWDGKQGTGMIIEQLVNKSSYAGPGGWNDPDFLMTDGGGQTPTEYYTEFSFWSLWSAPLVVATDVREMTPLKQAILFNAEVIAVNKDQLGRPGDYVFTDPLSGGEIWSRAMWDASKVVIFYNPHNSKTISFSCEFHAIGWRTNSTVAVRDLWAHKDLGDFQSLFSVVELMPHASRMLRMYNVLPPP